MQRYIALKKRQWGTKWKEFKANYIKLEVMISVKYHYHAFKLTHTY